ncbi:hypothetical protein PsAD13_05182 [Pseudovibrio sp. Ad13]|uniref:hypothetical protein n=1 Tax=Pseudovibrio sp. Ad13 TaxID=989396 RepID=UPI0007AE657B|nr:hypothetical protein [Pseudovibrio sp. Ad13]KZK79066.1 hypothetical protein PsAD13_05182 [Pseudovibrio sp. Ad13]
MVYPLAEQRLAQQHSAAHDVNPVQDEATVVSLEAFAQGIVDAHQSMALMTGGALDLATLPGTLLDSRSGHQLLKEIGIKGRYYTKIANGKTYVIFKGYPAVREVLKGTRYLSSSPKVVAFGIGPEAIRAGGRANAIIMITCYVALDVMQFIMSDTQLYSELFANIIVDVAIGAVAIGAGMAAAAAGALLAGAITTVAIPALAITAGAIVVGMAVGMALGQLDKMFGLREKLSAALRWTGEAVARGLQKTGQVIREAQVSMRQKVEELERRSNRFFYDLERETIWHLGGPDLYNQIYRR